MLIRSYTLSPHTRLVSLPERRLICAYPLQSLKLDAGEWALLSALQARRPIAEYLQGLTPDWIAYLERLTARGVLRAEYRVESARAYPSVEVIIPVFENAPGLKRCLEALAGLRYPRERLRVTVVDDASRKPIQEAFKGWEGGGLALRWLRTPANLGPGEARNLGVRTPWPQDTQHAAAPSELLAFVDSDCVPQPDWLAQLAAVLESPEIDAVGGGVVPLTASSLLGRYEGVCSSLVLGAEAGPAARPEHRFAYLPSCNLGVKRTAFERAEGFREGWRMGEDVDLCWRLADQGALLFYAPSAVVAHDFRVRWPAFLQRRRLYARSEAPLRRQHPARFAAPLTWGHWPFFGGLFLALSSGAPGWLLLSLAAWFFPAVRPLVQGLRGNFPSGPSWKERAAASLRAGGALPLHHGRLAARRALLVWVLLVIPWPHTWPVPVAVSLLGGLGEWLALRFRRGASRLHPFAFALGYLGDSLAYSLGWQEGATCMAWKRGVQWVRAFFYRPRTRGGRAGNPPDHAS